MTVLTYEEMPTGARGNVENALQSSGVNDSCPTPADGTVWPHKARREETRQDKTRLDGRWAWQWHAPTVQWSAGPTSHSPFDSKGEGGGSEVLARFGDSSFKTCNGTGVLGLR